MLTENDVVDAVAEYLKGRGWEIVAFDQSLRNLAAVKVVTA